MGAMKRESLMPQPKPQPPQACSGAEAVRRMAEANAKPFDLALLEAEPWTRGGFTWNGQPIGRSSRP